MQPTIIPRSEHRISRKQISPNALRTLYRLRNHGFTVYLVGGCVRDLLLERIPKDFDVVTDATPGQIRRLFRNCRLIGRRFRLAHLHFENEIIEVATFRRSARDAAEEREAAEHETQKHRHVRDAEGMVLRDNVFGTPEQDALSRDFTVNALFYNIADFSIIDYTGGMADLDQRIIRPIGDPLVRFTEDPVRMLRAVRFSASHTFSIEPATWEAIRDLSNLMSRVDSSRLYEEIQKTFLYGFAASVFPILDRSGMLLSVFPQFERWLYAKKENVNLVQSNLEYLDRLSMETRPTPALLFAAFFGAVAEEDALSLKHEGVPYLLALETVCKNLMEGVRVSVNVPKRITGQFRSLLSVQSVLRRIPPKRPASLVQRGEFEDGLSYLRMMSQARRENTEAVNWWDKYFSSLSGLARHSSRSEEISGKKKKRRRHKRRTRSQAERIDIATSGKEL